MWTLVIVVLMGSPSSVGGAGIGVNTAVSSFDFPSQEKCEEAAKALGTNPQTLQSPNGAGVAVFQIRAKCVAR
jgi:hypothetical protein